MTIGKRAKKFFYEKVLQSGERVYLDKQLSKIIDDIVSHISTNFLGIGMCYIDDYLFGEYVKIANTIYNKYGRKLYIDVFSNIVIKKIKEDGRLELVTEKQYIFPSQKEEKTLSVYREVRAKVFGEYRRYKYPGGARVYWNSDVTIDKEFVKEYVRNYFETTLKKSFWEEFRNSAKDFEFEICDFKYYLGKVFYSAEIKSLMHFIEISEEEIFAEIKSLAEAEDLVMVIEEKPDNVKSYYLSIKT